MKTVYKLIGLACLACSSLNAASFLVLIQNNDNNKYVRAEQWGGKYLQADVTSPFQTNEIRFIIEDTWWGTPWLEAGDPFWIRSEVNNNYWYADTWRDNGLYVRSNQTAPSPSGQSAFELTNRLDYGGVSRIKPNQIVFPNSVLYLHPWGAGATEIQHDDFAPFTPPNSSYFTFTILAVMQ